MFPFSRANLILQKSLEKSKSNGSSNIANIPHTADRQNVRRISSTDVKAATSVGHAIRRNRRRDVNVANRSLSADAPTMRRKRICDVKVAPNADGHKVRTKHTSDDENITTADTPDNDSADDNTHVDASTKHGSSPKTFESADCATADSQNNYCADDTDATMDTLDKHDNTHVDASTKHGSSPKTYESADCTTADSQNNYCADEHDPYSVYEFPDDDSHSALQPWTTTRTSDVSAIALGMRAVLCADNVSVVDAEGVPLSGLSERAGNAWTCPVSEAQAAGNSTGPRYFNLDEHKLPQSFPLAYESVAAQLCGASQSQEDEVQSEEVQDQLQDEAKANVNDKVKATGSEKVQEEGKPELKEKGAGKVNNKGNPGEK